MDIADKKAIVLGGTSGIGLETSLISLLKREQAWLQQAVTRVKQGCSKRHSPRGPDTRDPEAVEAFLS